MKIGTSRIAKIRARYFLFFCLNISVLLFFFSRLSGLEESRVYQEHELIADRVFDELEREFDAFLARESARDYSEYTQLVQEESDTPFIISYFQGSEDAMVSNNPARDAPYMERANQEQFELSTPEIIEQKAPKDVYSAQRMLNRSRKQKVRIPVPSSVGPMKAFMERDKLVLFREVQLADETIRQGLILDRRAFQEAISSPVLFDLSSGPISGEGDAEWLGSRRGVERPDWLHLDWEGGKESDSRFRFRYIFSAPFSALHVEVQIKQLAGMNQTRNILWVLGGFSSLLLGLGLFGLYRMQRLTEEAAQQRSDFVGAVSHELRTPITAVRLYSEMLGEGLVPEEKKAEYYQTMLAESIRLGALVEDVLSFSRLDRGQRMEAEASGSFQQVVDALKTRFGLSLAEAGFVFTEAYSQPARAVRVPVDIWVQMLSNLIDNARKFSAGSECKEILVSAEIETEWLVVQVLDRGPGIAREQLEEVKRPFVRGESEITRKTKGTGIGLALVDGLLAEMGGQLTLSNRAGGGLQVVLRVPAGEDRLG